MIRDKVYVSVRVCQNPVPSLEMPAYHDVVLGA